MPIEIKCVVPIQSEVGEGAVWDTADQVLWWVDILKGFIHRFDPETNENRTYDFGEPVGCLAVRENGGLLIASSSGFWFFDTLTGEREAIADPEENLPANRFNDGTTDAQGRFWAGTMKDDGNPAPVGTLYRLDADLTVTKWKGGLFTPNGLAFSADGTRMYFADTYPTVRKVWSSEYDGSRGTPGEPVEYFDSSSVQGRPDGGTVDAEGCYWTAGVCGWQLYRLSPEGELLTTIDLPFEKPSKPMFGGADLDVLYITSIGIGLSDDADQPEAGGLFAITGLGIKGIPQTRFRG